MKELFFKVQLILNTLCIPIPFPLSKRECSRCLGDGSPVWAFMEIKDLPPVTADHPSQGLY